MTAQGVSVVICCHNGERRLSETVKHISLQHVPSYIPWEFIFVDNASEDNSASTAQSIWNRLSTPAPLRIVYEPTLGLSNARAKGFAEAKYEYVLFCDDDNWLAEDYIHITYEIMNERPRVAAVGGFGNLIFETEPEAWIALSNIFAAGNQSARSGLVDKKRIHGAGCAIRKSAYIQLKDLGFKSLLSDRLGSSLTSGGDYELCYALSILGYDIWYDKRLQFSHFITKERLSWEYFMRYVRESSNCSDVLTPYRMIAEDRLAYNIPLVALMRDFAFCLRNFASINVRRVFTPKTTVQSKVLYFTHLVFKNKLRVYFKRYKAMFGYYKEIRAFKERCRAFIRNSVKRNQVPAEISGSLTP
jgi:glycosyltransferase involved in cell wall biosynthesis